jgi:hypothetical protein
MNPGSVERIVSSQAAPAPRPQATKATQMMAMFAGYLRPGIVS